MASPVRGPAFKTFIARLVVLGTEWFDDKLRKQEFNRLTTDLMKECKPEASIDEIDELVSLFMGVTTLETSAIERLVHLAHEEVSKDMNVVQAGAKRRRCS